ncbi:procathepsin L-like isoform X1 [Ruditapes philippinarum]|uniref:procathepsin L-like isoform X1 n=1 Tax=Ruditapes philippinarum TaxID=129788 RepID=UPI00295B8131|nr:procathepsin L-like isoform X1 [Ruditapes philippinarum]
MKMLRAVLLACLLAISLASNTFLDGEWESFKTAYNKLYEPQIEGFRRAIWESNIKYIERHNLEADRGLHTYRLGMNEYGDMTNTEFVSVMNGFKQNLTKSVCSQYSPPMNVDLSSLPDTVDWRNEGYVTEVKNQGQCGSCWSFSATGSLEGQNFKKTGKLVSLSEKNLMDCSKPEGNKGCEGGLMDQAFAYVIKNDGIDTEKSYPYKPKNGDCEFKKEDIGATETSCMDIKIGSEDDLQAAVATVGPIAIGIDASHPSFQLYRSGVYSERRCSSKNLDHGVLAVGYGKDFLREYWLVKNSWGTSWGKEGYIMMSRNKDNQCGIASQASFPTM